MIARADVHLVAFFEVEVEKLDLRSARLNLTGAVERVLVLVRVVGTAQEQAVVLMQRCGYQTVITNR